MLVDLQPKSTAPTSGRLHHKKVAEAAGDLAYLCAATALHLRNCAAGARPAVRMGRSGRADAGFAVGRDRRLRGGRRRRRPG